MNYTSEKYEQVWTLMYKILNALLMVINGLRWITFMEKYTYGEIAQYN